MSNRTFSYQWAVEPNKNGVLNRVLKGAGMNQLPETSHEPFTVYDTALPG